jgi:hypothetical protein
MSITRRIAPDSLGSGYPQPRLLPRAGDARLQRPIPLHRRSRAFSELPHLWRSILAMRAALRTPQRDGVCGVPPNVPRKRDLADKSPSPDGLLPTK